MKKLINAVTDVVPDFLHGLIALNPGLGTIAGSTTVVRTDVHAGTGQVSVISGGGSGHEPAHGGYVGAGMLSAAVAGEVFTSPSADAVLEAIRMTATSSGVLLVVKNYTGDRLNFGLAAELARAEGIPVEIVTVADDVALPAEGDHAGRRGLAGTVLVHKVAGAAAEAGLPLKLVAQIASRAAEDLGTMGVALTPCTVPAAGAPSFILGENEIEWGLGIHGEPGVEKTPLVSADEIVEKILGRILADLDVGPGDRVAVLVNNLGAAAAMDLSIVAGSAVRFLRKSGIVVERAWAGTFLTALEMGGCSLSVLRVDDERLKWLDASTTAPAWPAAHLGKVRAAVPALPAPAPEKAPDGPCLSRQSTAARMLAGVCRALIAAETELTDMDLIVGDGDLGNSLARGAHALLQDLPRYPHEDRLAEVLSEASSTVRRVVGGTSGPLYAVLLLRGAAVLDSRAQDTGAARWIGPFNAAVAGIAALGGAARGDRTMLDALYPAAEAFCAAAREGSPMQAALAAAAEAAVEGTRLTGQMMPKRGRSSYAGQRVLGHPDPGAHAVSIWLGALRDCVADADAGAHLIRN